MSSYFECQKGVPGSQEELSSNVSQVGFCPGESLSGRQRGVYWALQQHDMEADTSFLVSTDNVAWEKEVPTPSPSDYKHYPQHESA